jgi:hypothetical protein
MLLDQLADIRAALFNFAVPDELAQNFLHDRVFDFKPTKLTVPVAPTREFWMHVLATKIEETIRNPGDMIGWEDDEETVGPVASPAKQSLLGALPSILPPEVAGVRLYLHVLEHGDYGIHNTSISTLPDGSPLVTSLFDWETACIAPALLADPLVAVISSQTKMASLLWLVFHQRKLSSIWTSTRHGRDDTLRYVRHEPSPEH